jgi:hypothetical protein
VGCLNVRTPDLFSVYVSIVGSWIETMHVGGLNVRTSDLVMSPLVGPGVSPRGH